MKNEPPRRNPRARCLYLEGQVARQKARITKLQGLLDQREAAVMYVLDNMSWADDEPARIALARVERLVREAMKAKPVSAQERAARALLRKLGPLPCSGCDGSGEALGHRRQAVGHRCRACLGTGHVCRSCDKPAIDALCEECR